MDKITNGSGTPKLTILKTPEPVPGEPSGVQTRDQYHAPSGTDFNVQHSNLTQSGTIHHLKVRGELAKRFDIIRSKEKLPFADEYRTIADIWDALQNADNEFDKMHYGKMYDAAAKDFTLRYESWSLRLLKDSEKLEMRSGEGYISPTYDNNFLKRLKNVVEVLEVKTDAVPRVRSTALAVASHMIHVLPQGLFEIDENKRLPLVVLDEVMDAVLKLEDTYDKVVSLLAAVRIFDKLPSELKRDTIIMTSENLRAVLDRQDNETNKIIINAYYRVANMLNEQGCFEELELVFNKHRAIVEATASDSIRELAQGVVDITQKHCIAHMQAEYSNGMATGISPIITPPPTPRPMI